MVCSIYIASGWGQEITISHNNNTIFTYDDGTVTSAFKCIDINVVKDDIITMTGRLKHGSGTKFMLIAEN